MEINGIKSAGVEGLKVSPASEIKQQVKKAKTKISEIKDRYKTAKKSKIPAMIAKDLAKTAKNAAVLGKETFLPKNDKQVMDGYLFNLSLGLTTCAALSALGSPAAGLVGGVIIAAGPIILGAGRMMGEIVSDSIKGADAYTKSRQNVGDQSKPKALRRGIGVTR